MEELGKAKLTLVGPYEITHIDERIKEEIGGELESEFEKRLRERLRYIA